MEVMLGPSTYRAEPLGTLRPLHTPASLLAAALPSAPPYQRCPLAAGGGMHVWESWGQVSRTLVLNLPEPCLGLASRDPYPPFTGRKAEPGKRPFGLAGLAWTWLSSLSWHRQCWEGPVLSYSQVTVGQQQVWATTGLR